ncbi:MAG TPA: ABC transporter permease [Devosiaceae bacterium]
MSGTTGPVLIVLAVLLVVWYAAATLMNASWQTRLYERAGKTDVPLTQYLGDLWSQSKPLLPAPHQIVVEVYANTFAPIVGCWTAADPGKVDRLTCTGAQIVRQFAVSKRSFLYHAGITLTATLLGFAFGTVLGLLLAVMIIHIEAMNRSLMPWIIASQTVPILAIAPMLVVGLNAVGVTGLVPKALISTYLSFFPVVVGMVKGLRSPDQMQLDLMHTYSATRTQIFTKLRWPASMPFLFASMKVGVAIALIGALVAELTNTAAGGLGVRLLTGSYNGQTITLWAVLLMAATLAAILVIGVGIAERIVLRRMGQGA